MPRRVANRPAPTDGPVKYLAFLRGMNVGGHRVSMSTLRAEFEALGLARVETYIATGNVIFETSSAVPAAELEATIEARLLKSLGYPVATFLRTPAALRLVTDRVPFPDELVNTPGYKIHVGFLRDAPGPVLSQALRQAETSYDAFGVGARELYWLCRGRSSDTLVKWPALERAHALVVTMRNLTTVRTLAGKYSPPS